MRAREATTIERPEPRGDAEVRGYLEALSLIVMVEHWLMRAVHLELGYRGFRHVNPVQAMMLYRLGDKEVSAGELRTGGYYLGTNASYNLAKLVSLGLLDHQRRAADKRAVRIKATEEGRAIGRMVDALWRRHARKAAALGDLPGTDLDALNRLLDSMLRFVTEQVVYKQV